MRFEKILVSLLHVFFCFYIYFFECVCSVCIFVILCILFDHFLLCVFFRVFCMFVCFSFVLHAIKQCLYLSPSIGRSCLLWLVHYFSRRGSMKTRCIGRQTQDIGFVEVPVKPLTEKTSSSKKDHSKTKSM